MSSNTKGNLLKTKIASLEQENKVLEEQLNKEKELAKSLRDELKNIRE